MTLNVSTGQKLAFTLKKQFMLTNIQVPTV